MACECQDHIKPKPIIIIMIYFMHGFRHILWYLLVNVILNKLCVPM